MMTSASKARLRALFVYLFLFAGLGALQHLIPSIHGHASRPNIHPSAEPQELTGETTPFIASQKQAQRDHLRRLGVLDWHARGIRGQGIKVAILDSGFRGYRDCLGTVLPTQVQTQSFRKDKDLEARISEHGILCAEVVHAIAPAAELLLVNWESNDPKSFLDAFAWAKREGAKIITCSLIMPSWSDGEGGGWINQSVAELVYGKTGEREVLFFAAAGNTAQRHWWGLLKRDDNGFHTWTEDATENTIVPWGDDRVAVELYGPSASAMALEVIETETGRHIPPQAMPFAQEQSASSHAVTVRFYPEPHSNYRIRVKSKPSHGEDGKSPFHLVVLGGNLKYSTHRGSICFPADGPGALAVGAVDMHNQRCPFSSCGPNSPLPKPDFVAPTPFPSLRREQPFAGTSAAAPQAAALAALLWSAQPRSTAEQVREALQKSARDLGPEGHDHETGYGVVRVR